MIITNENENESFISTKVEKKNYHQEMVARSEPNGDTHLCWGKKQLKT